MDSIKDFEWHFEMDEDPKPKGRPRFTSKGRPYTPGATMRYEDDICDALVLQRPAEPLEGPLAVRLIFYLRKPPSVAKKRKYPAVRPDLDNYIKSILDAAQKAKIFKDDGQICDLAAFKRYAVDTSPKVLMSVEKLDQ